MDDFGELSEDEIGLVKSFRNGDRLDRARIWLATSPPPDEPNDEELLRLKTFAAYLECNEYGRSRCLARMEIYAAATSIKDADAKIAEMDAARDRSNVVDIASFRT